jgi:glutamine amidotransferase
MSRVTVVDYGMGNLFSVRRAFEQCGVEVAVSDKAQAILDAERLVLPGVGAFQNGMEGLEKRGLVEAILQFSSSGRPFLGICLGMQMLHSASDEFGVHRGLGIIPGRVVGIPLVGADGNSHKIPHIGWNSLIPSDAGASWQGTILEGIEPGAAVYFVHSYEAVTESPVHRIAHALYDGCKLTAVVRKGAVFGCQFHPEKSGRVGLKILANFSAMST